MYKYFSTTEQKKFMEVTELLKEKSLAAGDEQTFYRAWGNQAIYLSLREQRTKAKEVVGDMKQYANEHKSHFGEYTAMHVQGSVYLRMHDYANAENSFKEAVDLLHTHFPNESAAADYLELVTIANRRGNSALGKEYGEKVLKEPNLQPQHKIRAFSMLCQYAYTEGDEKRFNELYNEWKELLQKTSGGSLEATVETEYLIINKRYEEALKTCENVPLKNRGSLRAHIYHLMGDDVNAYKCLKRWVSVKDSINKADQANVFSDYIIQAQNERLENERLRLEGENKTLRARIYIILVIAVIIIAAILIYKRQKTVKILREDNKHLDDARQKAEQAQNEVQKALDLKREFLYNISQELRTPLNPITGMSDLLTDDEYHFQAEERVAMNQHIKDNTKLLTKMVDNMIELSFYESKVSLPMDTPISPNIICRHMVDTLKNDCPDGLEMNFESTVPGPVMIKTNVDCIEKVIRHLVNNAFEHTTAGHITVRCSLKENRVCIAVEDTGTGVAPELADSILNASVQKDSQFKTTGMGLSICQAILKLLNGRIYLDKEYKAGARFVFELEAIRQES
ncbi:MAG: HAMP domain-containing histidine kinase [Prevotella sp.]|nr:HAMP domain-containing histidine kinase [Prevotella sp.]